MEKLVNKLMNHGFTRARAVMFIGEVINKYNDLMIKTTNETLDSIVEGIDEDAASDDETMGD